MYVNHAINFYRYCLTGKRFRQELSAMLNCDRVTRACRGADDTAAAAGVVAGVGGARALALHDDVRDAHPGRRQPPRGRLSHNQAKCSSTSSRTRSGRTMRKLELVDERYS